MTMALNHNAAEKENSWAQPENQEDQKDDKIAQNRKFARSISNEEIGKYHSDKETNESIASCDEEAIKKRRIQKEPHQNYNPGVWHPGNGQMVAYPFHYQERNSMEHSYNPRYQERMCGMQRHPMPMAYHPMNYMPRAPHMAPNVNNMPRNIYDSDSYRNYSSDQPEKIINSEKNFKNGLTEVNSIHMQAELQEDEFLNNLDALKAEAARLCNLMDDEGSEYEEYQYDPIEILADDSAFTALKESASAAASVEDSYSLGSSSDESGPHRSVPKIKKVKLNSSQDYDSVENWIDANPDLLDSFNSLPDKFFPPNDDKTFSCIWPDCNSNFPNRSRIKRHYFTHIKIKPFKCKNEQCRRRFNRQDNMIAHYNKNCPFTRHGN